MVVISQMEKMVLSEDIRWRCVSRRHRMVLVDVDKERMRK